VDVAALPPPDVASPEEAIRTLFDRIDADPPAAVLVWNALAAHKVLLADGLLDTPLFDASPGEMYYEALDRYFEHPRPGLPYRAPADYGARLSGAIVKYQGEAERAARVLGAPVHVVPNGVPCAAGPPATGAPREGPLVIGTLARLDPRKKVHQLLEAVALANGRLPPHVLRIAGGVERGCAEYAEELRRRAPAGVEWLGEVGDPAPFLRALDLFALIAEPAGCPNASLEAMSAGLAVVATDVGGIAEQVVDGLTGHVVGRDDTAAMADALVRLAWDPAGRARLGQAGRDRIRRDFHVDRMVEDYRRICLGPGSSAGLACSLQQHLGAGVPSPSQGVFP
jgi:glycosyltransferase involved in cell wall biosynthesis